MNLNHERNDMIQGNNFRHFPLEDSIAKQAQLGALQCGAPIKPERAPSEISTELGLLHEALNRLSTIVAEMGDRLEPVSLRSTGCDGCSDAPKPVMSQTATSIANARGVVEGLVGRLGDQIDALRC